MLFTRLKFLLKRCFTWWNGQTLGTWLYTKRFGVHVGNDDFGNSYYQNTDKTRRWVIYDNHSEATAIPPDWHAWIHKMIDVAPSDKPFVVKIWEKPHLENLTGTADAYAPPASLTKIGHPERRKASGDYESWTPKS